MIRFHKDSVTVEDCYKFSLLEIEYCVRYIKNSDDCPEEVLNRHNFSLENEILTHKLFYKLGICKERTKDCDLDKETTWHKVGYCIIGLIYRLFVK